MGINTAIRTVEDFLNQAKARREALEPRPRENPVRADGGGPDVAASLLDALAERVASRLVNHLDHRDKQPAESPKGTELLSIEEVARRLGLSTSTVYKRAEAGALPSVKDGGRLLFQQSDVEAYIAQRRRSPERIAQFAREIAGRRDVRRRIAARTVSDGPRSVQSDSRSAHNGGPEEE